MSIVTVTETKSYTVDWVALAAGVERLVLEKMKNDLEHWADSLSMKQMFVQDAADSLAVCEAMQDSESWSVVEEKLWDMDTAARDYVYDFIAEVAGADFFDIVR